jgi:hypothetical protein
MFDVRSRTLLNKISSISTGKTNLYGLSDQHFDRRGECTLVRFMDDPRKGEGGELLAVISPFIEKLSVCLQRLGPRHALHTLCRIVTRTEVDRHVSENRLHEHLKAADGRGAPVIPVRLLAQDPLNRSLVQIEIIRNADVIDVTSIIELLNEKPESIN